VSALSATRPVRSAAKRTLSKRAVVLARPVDPAELKRSPNRARAMARVMVWAVACVGAAFLIPHVMM
jgi:type VI protein secretion system component VasF